MMGNSWVELSALAAHGSPHRTRVQDESCCELILVMLLTMMIGSGLIPGSLMLLVIVDAWLVAVVHCTMILQLTGPTAPALVPHARKLCQPSRRASRTTP